MKHAYLIMAHSNWGLLRRLLYRLDDNNNEIFIHIDKKSKITKRELKEIKDICKNSKVSYIPRHKVTWGGYSMINCELRLLEEAVKSDVEYCHFLSGNDYLLKPIRYVNDFFILHSGKEFVDIAEREFIEKEQFRYKYYHPLQEIIGRDRKTLRHKIEKVLLLVQKYLKIDRTKAYMNIQFRGGSQWCSITKEFAIYLLEHEDDIKKMFKYSFCCDEIFVQTMIYNSPFREKRYVEQGEEDYHACLRFIDWKRGNPYIFTEEDFEALIKSDYLFCRKVSNDDEIHVRLLDKLDTL